MTLESYDICCVEDIEVRETEWLWYPYIPYGKITIIQGDPGEGKTTLALNIAAALSRGKILGSDEETEAGNIIYQTAEDGFADTIKPRLVAAGADCTKIKWVNESYEPLSFTDERLEEAIQRIQPKLVILDPLQAYLGANVDMHRANEIRPVMSRLASLAHGYQCAIVLIGHMNKNMGTKSSYRGLGSIDLTAAARSVLVVAREKKDKQIRVVAQIKSSLAPEGDTIAFRLSENNGFTFMGKYEADIDALLMGVGKTSQRSAASVFLKEFLAEGKKPSLEIYAAAAQRGISPKTLRRAKDELNIRVSRKESCWFWELNGNDNT